MKFVVDHFNSRLVVAVLVSFKWFSPKALTCAFEMQCLLLNVVPAFVHLHFGLSEIIPATSTVSFFFFSSDMRNCLLSVMKTVNTFPNACKIYADILITELL